jgi:hypothetical protein
MGSATFRIRRHDDPRDQARSLIAALAAGPVEASGYGRGVDHIFDEIDRLVREALPAVRSERLRPGAGERWWL